MAIFSQIRNEGGIWERAPSHGPVDEIWPMLPITEAVRLGEPHGHGIVDHGDIFG
jgi:hypothetical protein